MRPHAQTAFGPIATRKTARLPASNPGYEQKIAGLKSFADIATWRSFSFQR
jgi:hypothetical protein